MHAAAHSPNTADAAISEADPGADAQVFNEDWWQLLLFIAETLERQMSEKTHMQTCTRSLAHRSIIWGAACGNIKQ